MGAVRERVCAEARAAEGVASLLLRRAAAAAEVHPAGLAVVTTVSFVLVAVGVSTAASLADESGYILAAADCFPWFAEGFMLSAVIPAAASLLVAAAMPRNANEVVRLNGSAGIRSVWTVAAVGCSLMAAVLATAAVGIVGCNWSGPVSSFGYENGMLANVLGVCLELPEAAGFGYAASLFFSSAFLSGLFASSVAAVVMHLGGNPVLGLVIAVAVCQANAASGDPLGLMCGGFVSLATFGAPAVRGAVAALAALLAAAALTHFVPRRDWLGP